MYIIIKNFTNLVTKKCTTFIGCKDRKKSVQEAVARKIATVLQRYPDGESLKDTHPKQIRRKSKRKPAIPPQEKVKKVFSYINKHPNCNTTDVVAKTKLSSRTVERCIAELKQQGFIEHTGSKKLGGYEAVAPND
ncbi:MAG: winged helix-turn-helix transcriptional regulator [Bacteroidales bacterium]|nr:winged helix-turn-helix transcriptional regulator [Bacteroidales bacterium]